MCCRPAGLRRLFEPTHGLSLIDPHSQEATPLGLNNYTTLAYVDERYFWYSWYAAADGRPRFLRAPQLELTDLIPEE